MYPENIKRKLEYKLRELELIIKQITRDAEVAGIDLDLALEKTRYLYDLLLRLKTGITEEPEMERQSIPTGKPVVPSDPDPVEDNNIYEAEGIIPSPSGYMRREGPHREQKETGATQGKHPDEDDGGKEHTGGKEQPVLRENASREQGSAKDEKHEAGEDATGEEKGAGDSEPDAGENAPGKPFGEKEEDPVTGEASREKNGPEPGPDNAGQELPSSERSENKKTGSKENESNRTNDIEIIADKYQSSQNYINQAIASKQTRDDLTTRMRSRPISDLRNSIGLNDKFLFIKELFKGRPEKYNQCIDDLNKAASYEEALDIAKSKYSLDEKNEAVKKLLTLVKRKSQDL